MFTHTKRGKTGLKIFGVLALLLIIAVSGFTLYARNWYKDALQPVSASSEVVVVEIKQGLSPKDIALLLEQKGLIRSARAFETYVRGSGDGPNLKAGSYELSASMSTQEVVSVIVEGLQTSTLFTIGPGIRVDQIKKRLVAAGFTESAIDEALKPEKYSDIPVVKTLPEGASLEGYIYPETFRVDPATTPETIIRQALQELDKIISPELQAKFSVHGLTTFEAITIASIVEKEVPSIEDRKVVAQIFLSRLSQGIMLGSDATYYYASVVFGGEPFPDLDSPYNTRIYTGIPPGPINNVSLSALSALADPADTDYLFFVTGDDGVNHFTRTDAEHQSAVKQYCKISCATGYVPDL